MSLIRLRDVSFLERFPFAVTDYYGDWLFSVFLLEGLMLLLMTVYLHRHRGEKNRWIRFLAVWLPLQAFGESMRQDAILRFGFVKTGELFCAVGLLLILLVLCIRQGRGRTILSVMGLLGCFGLFMAMEFALEGKIRFLRWMTMDLCYLVIALSCAGMMILVTRHVPGERRSLK